MSSPCASKKAQKQENEVASTSKFDWELDNTVETLGKMMIGCKRYKKEDSLSDIVNKVDDDKPSCSTEVPPQNQEKRRSSWSFRSGRYTPYLLPKKPKTRSRSMSELDFNALAKIRWKGDKDLDYLKLSILDDKKPVSCGIEAARPPTPDIEVDELSEYFSHFVRVEMKMSALAESMYC